MGRNLLIDRLKGYACFLVLFGHVIMGMRNAGIVMPSFLFGLEKFIWTFHVPLFLFLSGAVYSITDEWHRKKTKFNFIKYKLLKLGVPYFVFSVIYILINSLSGDTNTSFSANDILTLWKTPVAQYWYLYALFFLLCIWTVFSGILKPWKTTVLLTALGYIIYEIFGETGSLSMVLSSALSFGIGTFSGISFFDKTSVKIKISVIAFHILSGCLIIYFGFENTPFVKELFTVLGIVSSIFFISVIQNTNMVSRFLDFMNRYSFQTYLLHTIFTAGIRIILLKTGISNWGIHIFAGCICGLAFSVISSVIAERFKVLNWFFFPEIKRK